MNNLTKRILSSIILLPLIIYIIIQGSFVLLFFTFICFFASCYEWHMMTKNIYHKIFGFIFLTASLYTFYKLAINDYEVFIVILICVSTDVGGYVFGKLLQGPKLTKISPNKTYAGMIGGYLLSITSLTLVLNIIDIKISYFQFFLIIFVISTVSQLGDITISYFKRLSNIKNTGNLIPGHGGLLDRIDGMIFAFPIFYLISLEGYKII